MVRDECTKCPIGATCEEGTTLTTLVLHEGQFRFSVDSTEVYACPVQENCVGGQYEKETLGCREGATGTLCSACVPGYHYKRGKGCTVCSMTGGSWNYSLGAFVGWLVVFGLFYHSRKRIKDFYKVTSRAS